MGRRRPGKGTRDERAGSLGLALIEAEPRHIHHWSTAAGCPEVMATVVGK